MANIYDEIRIIFRGPCERLFIAYKPLGWHVCSPSGKKKFDNSLSSVMAAKLRIPEDSIKFPSKLKINQKGLVIGTTDDPMYSQICKIIENRECSKFYTCLINTNLRDFVSKNKSLNIIFEDSSNYNSEISGRIDFNLKKFDKRSQTDPDVTVDSTPTTHPHYFNFKLSNLDNFINNSGNSLSSVPHDTNHSHSDKYSVMEIETNNKFVDKHLYQILDNLGINIVNGYNKILNENYKMVQLSKIKIPHPIFRDRLITSSVNFEIANLINRQRLNFNL